MGYKIKKTIYLKEKMKIKKENQNKRKSKINGVKRKNEQGKKKKKAKEKMDKSCLWGEGINQQVKKIPNDSVQYDFKLFT